MLVAKLLWAIPLRQIVRQDVGWHRKKTKTFAAKHKATPPPNAGFNPVDEFDFGEVKLANAAVWEGKKSTTPPPPKKQKFESLFWGVQKMPQ